MDWVFTISAILSAAVLLGAMLARYWYVPFLRNPDRIDLTKLGLKVTTPERKQRVKLILAAFFGGFNAMLKEKRMSGAQARCDEFPPLLRPFAREGAAMAFPFKAIFTRKHKLREFEQAMTGFGKQYFLMYYIGLGFWCGVVHKLWPSRVKRVADRLHPFYRYLCYDGFGFNMGLFQYLKDPAILSNFHRFEDYASHACYQGFGRSLWFLYMDAPASLENRISQIEEAYRGDCYSGLGLAVAFTNMDDLPAAFDLAEKIEPRYLTDYFLGVIIALYTRRMIDADYFNDCLGALESWQRAMVAAGLQSCDDRFVEVAANFTGDHYEQWRKSIACDLSAALAPRAVGAMNLETIN